MKRTQTISGWWWLPDMPEKKVPGTVVIERGTAAVLTLLQELPVQRRGYRPVRSIPVILGESVTGHKAITLFDCGETHLSLGRYALPPSEYSSVTIAARRAIIGAHFTDKDSPVTQVAVGFSNVNDWANVDRGIDYQWDAGDVMIKTAYEQRVAYIDTSINGGFTVQLVLAVGPWDRPLRHKRGVQSRPFFRITSDVGRPVHEYDRIITGIQNFLTLAIQRPISVRGITAWPDYSANTNTITSIPYDGATVEVYSRIAYHGPVDKSYCDPSRMLMPLSSIEDVASSAVKQWIEDAPGYDLAYHLYFAVAFNKHLYAENEFLNYVQALEGYQRRLAGDDKHMKQSEYKTIVRSIIDSLPGDLPKELRESMANGLRRANDFSLRDRLVAIIGRRSVTFRQRLFKDESHERSFIAGVVETRNYFSHVLDRTALKKVIPQEGGQLYVANIRLKILVEACLLELCGMRSEKIDEILSSRLYDIPISM